MYLSMNLSELPKLSAAVVVVALQASRRPLLYAVVAWRPVYLVRVSAVLEQTWLKLVFAGAR
jgi:hypothetical protein